VDIADLRSPQFVAGGRIDAADVGVEVGDEDAAVGVNGAAVDGVAAGDPLGKRGRLGLVLPLQRRAFFGQVEGVEDVRPGGDDVQGVAGDDGGRLLAAVDAGVERPGRLEVLDVARERRSPLPAPLTD